jgi:hypothetical protein
LAFQDHVKSTSSGIGSAERISYSILIQGKTQALESDVILFMKSVTRSAVSSVMNDNNLEDYFDMMVYELFYVSMQCLL